MLAISLIESLFFRKALALAICAGVKALSLSRVLKSGFRRSNRVVASTIKAEATLSLALANGILLILACQVSIQAKAFLEGYLLQISALGRFF